VVKEEPRPINSAPRIIIGSKPIDGGYLIVEDAERSAFLERQPEAGRWLRPFIGAVEYINGGRRWIFALQNCPPDTLKSMPAVMERVQAVREYREGKRPARKVDPLAEPKRQGISAASLASTPTAFHVTVIPTTSFLAIPEVSSERRDFVPIGWLKPPTIPSNLVRILPDASPWHFAILTSSMHMAWLRHIGGRLESRYRYSIGLVYNTFPWPNATSAHQDKVQELARAVLEVRARYPTSSLADLYDPDTMPGDLRKAHAALDAAVDRLYRPTSFTSDRDRVEHLFGRYEALVNPLEREGVRQNKRISRQTAKAAE
jgi:hypothetical protein